MQREILVIEDDRVLNDLLVALLRGEGHGVIGVQSWAEADAYLKGREPNLIIADARLRDGDSLARLPDLAHTLPVVVLTAYGSVRNAVQAMQAGAFEYLLKPINPEELILVVERALKDVALRNEHQLCLRQLKAREPVGSYMIGVSSALQGLVELIDAVAPTPVTVLIQGESGTGKELVARALHEGSERAARSFVTLDCCTLQEKLFESELFGHEKGAFTGADRQKKGLIEGAEGGTLFLDEIGEIDPGLQAKLLRVLETGRFRRLGGTRDLAANVRILAATNRDLEALSRTGGFRPDLYYRLSAFVIQTPPLRERREDIPFLAEHFVNNHKLSRRVDKQITPEAQRRLTAYDWPGNVRELRNVIERAIILSRDKPRIGPEHLGFRRDGGQGAAKVTLSFDHDPTLEEVEAAYLSLQLRKFSGRRAQVAEVLNISERNIYRLIKRYGLVECPQGGIKGGGADE